MRCVKIIAELGKADIAQIIVVQAIAPCPVTRDIKNGKFLAMHKRADGHGGRMGFGINFSYRRNAGAQHGYRIMRRKQLSGQADIGKVAADRRCPFVPDKAVIV